MKTKMILGTLGVACFSLALGACGYGDKEEKASGTGAEAETTGSLVEDIQESAETVVEEVEQAASEAMDAAEDKVSEVVAAGQEKLDEAMNELNSDAEADAQSELEKLKSEAAEELKLP